MAKQPAFSSSCIGAFFFLMSLFLCSNSYAFYIQNVEEAHVDGKNLICARFSEALDNSQSLGEYFSVYQKQSKTQPAGSVTDDRSWELQTPSEGSAEQKVICYASTAPNTAYEITVLSGLPAASGATLKNTSTFEVKTRHLQPAASFASSGSILIPELSEGIPIIAVNTPEVKLDFYRLTREFIDDNINDLTRGAIYRLGRNIGEQSEPIFSGQYSLDIPKNTRATRLISLDGIDKIKESGVYLVALSRPGYYYNIEYRYFMVSDLGVHARFYEDEIHFHVSSLTDASPVYDAQIRLYDAKDDQVRRISTDDQGQAKYRRTKNRQPSYVLVSKDDQLTYIAIQQPSLDLSEFDVSGRPYQDQEMFLYSSRDLYRPGEAVTVSGLLRDADGRVQPPVVLKAEVVAPGNQSQSKLQVAARDMGYYQFDFTIPASARTGDWQLRVRKPDGNTQSYPFKVEEFLPERLELLLDPEDERSVLRPDESFDLPIEGNYLYGAPAAGNQYTARVRSNHWRQPFADERATAKLQASFGLTDDQIVLYKRFHFGDETDKQGIENYALNNGRLDEDGRTKLSVRNRWKQSGSPMRVSTAISLQESGGRPVTRTHHQLVWPSQSMLGIAPLFGKEQLDANTLAEFDLLRLSKGLKSIAGSDIEVRLIRESERYFWQYTANRGWHYQWSSSEYLEYRDNVSLDADSPAKISVPVEWGKYRLEALDPDSKAKTTLKFTAGYRWYWRWRNAEDQQNSILPDRVVLAWDKEHYQAGDEAVLNIVAPFAGEQIVLVESDELLWAERIAADPAGGTNTQLQIPVSESWERHDIYVSVISLRPADKADLVTPNRAVGVIHLPLDRTDRELSVRFADRDENLDPSHASAPIRKAEPNSRYPIELVVQNNDGTVPDRAMITLAAVDVGVLNVTDFETPDAHKWLFEPRRYGVDARDVYSQVIELSDDEKARLRFGGDALTKSRKQPDSEIKIHQIFSGLVPVDQTGRAQIDLDLPDFNGRMRLMALAFSEDSYGMAEDRLQIAAPLVAEIAMPRFVAQGDRTEFALDLTNTTDEPIQLNAELTTSDLISISALEGADDQQAAIELEPGERKTLRYSVDVGMSLGTAELELDVSSDHIRDFQRSWAPEVRAAYPEESRRQPILLGSANTDVLLDKNLLDGLIPETLEISLVMSNDLNLQAANQSASLFQYPYGCLEQTSSRLYPWVWLNNDNRTLLGVDEETLKKQDENIKLGLSRIATMQKNHGGFGYWSNTSDESQWITVFVAELLYDLHEQGLVSDLTMLGSANERLKTYVARSISGNRYTLDAGHYQISYRAYAAYVLAKQRKTTLGKVRTLTTAHLQDAKSPLPYVHLGLAHMLLGDEKTANDLFDQAQSIQRNQDYLGDYGSPQRDQAAILALYAEHDISEFERASIGLKLSEDIHSRRYLSTQERAYLLRAAIAMDAYSSTDAVPLSLYSNAGNSVSGGKLLGELDVSGETEIPVSVEQLNSGVRLSLPDTDWLQGQLLVKGFPEEHPLEDSEREAAPFSIERFYYNEDGEEIDLAELTQGELVVTHLRISSPERYQDALVVDLLPAGLELENQNLKHAIKLDKIYVDEQPLSYWSTNNDIVFQEYRDDRYVAAVDLGYRWRATNLYYLARAVVPGEYVVPPTLVEDMYRPEKRNLGDAQPNVLIKSLPESEDTENSEESPEDNN